MFLEISQNSQKNTCARISFLELQTCNFIKKETPAQAFSYEFDEISENTFFAEHSQATEILLNWFELRTIACLTCDDYICFKKDWGNNIVQNQPPEVFNKYVFLKISPNSQENTFARVSF